MNQANDAQAWLNERVQPGRWLDIDPKEEIPPAIDGWWRTIVHMHQVSFSPEIRKRRDAGALAEDFVLWAAQLIQPHEGPSSVRLNEEVRGVAHVRTSREVEEGDTVLVRDLENFEYFDLLDEELDSGHFTIFWNGSGWVGSFDFRAARAKCLALVEKALTFVTAARLSAAENLAEPAVDNLHTASENLAKVRLILTHRDAHKWKSHGAVSSAINQEGKLGNVDPAFLDLFNRLANIRSHAKYATGWDGAPPTRDELDLVESMAVALRENIARKRAP